MTSNEETARRFLQLVNSHYDEYKKKWRTHNMQKGQVFDDDVFSQTILTIYDKILKSGVSDPSDKGLENYFFKSVMMNNRRELLYPYLSKRDMNVEPFDVMKDLLDDSDIDGLKKEEARRQYFMYHLLKEVQDTFDMETFRIFRIFYLYPKMTYTRLQNLTKIKNVKKKILNVRNYLQENIDRNRLNSEFEEWYSEEKDNFW